MGQAEDVVQCEVSYLTDEDILQYRPARYARSEPIDGFGPVDYPPFDYVPVSYPMAAPMIPFPPMTPGYPVMQETDVIRRFLLEVGLPEGSLRGGRGDLVSYLRGRLGM